MVQPHPRTQFQGSLLLIFSRSASHGARSTRRSLKSVGASLANSPQSRWPLPKISPVGILPSNFRSTADYAQKWANPRDSACQEAGMVNSLVWGLCCQVGLAGPFSVSERSEGSSAAGTEARATTLYSVGSVETRTMMQSCASAARLRGGGPILFLGMRAMGISGVPPPRIVRPVRARLRACRAACQGRVSARELIAPDAGGRRPAPPRW